MAVSIIPWSLAESRWLWFMGEKRVRKCWMVPDASGWMMMLLLSRIALLFE
jgi:hypothetical protein